MVPVLVLRRALMVRAVVMNRRFLDIGCISTYSYFEKYHPGLAHGASNRMWGYGRMNLEDT
jgi:hypothetical protein